MTTTIDPWTSWLSAIDRDQLRYVASRFLAPFPLHPFARSPPTTMIALAPRGRVVPCFQAGITAGSIGGGKEWKVDQPKQHSMRLQASLEVESWSASAKGLTLTFPSSSISTLDVSSSFHHHSIIDLVVPSLDIQDRPALSHTLFS